MVEELQTLKGRANTPVRPGFVVKNVLMGQQAVYLTGELTTEVSVVDLHRTYKALVKEENQSRPIAKRLRGMTYKSFVTLFKFAQLKGLVELVEEREMEMPPPSGHLLSIRKEGEEFGVVRSKIRVFRLTEAGRQDERSWANLCKSWIEGWPVPQPLGYAIPTTRPLVVRPPIKEEPTWTPIKKAETYSIRAATTMLKHLKILDVVGINSPGVRDELERVVSIMADWDVNLDIKIEKEEAKKKPSEELLERYNEKKEDISTVAEHLEEGELKEAIEAMEKLT